MADNVENTNLSVCVHSGRATDGSCPLDLHCRVWKQRGPHKKHSSIESVFRFSDQFDKSASHELTAIPDTIGNGKR